MRAQLTRRRALTFGAAALLAPTLAKAQDNGRPITVIVPFAAGGSTDLVARIVAQHAAPLLGAPVVVDNRTGGGGVIGWGAAARSTPDGTTLCTIELSYAIAAGLIANLPFNPHKAFAQITTAVKVPHVLVVNGQVQANDVREFIALAKSRPGALNYGSGGSGTNTHLAGELFKKQAGVDLVHIPYKGAGAVLSDLMSGNVQALITSIPTALPHIRSGRLRALMVTGARRNASLPDTPSAAEAGLPGMDMDFWIGFGAPAGTPTSTIAKLHRALAGAVALPAARKRFDELGMTVVANSPAESTALVSREIERWTAVIKSSQIKAE